MTMQTNKDVSAWVGLGTAKAANLHSFVANNVVGKSHKAV